MAQKNDAGSAGNCRLSRKEQNTRSQPTTLQDLAFRNRLNFINRDTAIALEVLVGRDRYSRRADPEHMILKIKVACSVNILSWGGPPQDAGRNCSADFSGARTEKSVFPLIIPLSASARWSLQSSRPHSDPRRRRRPHRS